MREQSILNKFGDRVRELRTKKGLSQEKLAELANLHRTYIGMIERSETNITLANIEKIANALNVSMSEIFDNY
ncbi:MAG: helix-turn-helix domain-containing protein [Ignavibacteria bacterium]|jgi:transcriptional regulator with XRE-family HTH domain|nr:helix-turn-helix domain-containing protein [Ignavibacteria bacterium]